MIPSGVTRRVATVFGGAGFLGRYIVKRLAERGYVVRVAVRDPEAALFLKPMGAVGQIVPLYASVTNDALVRRAVEGAAVVINLVGILAERRRGDFDSVQHEGAARVAREAAASGVSRLVHVSAIGADPESDSAYERTKGLGEAAVRAAFPDATILRPSLVFGPEDQFFNRFAGLARLLPVMPVIEGGTRMQPVYVGDVADAAIAAIEREDAAGTVFELGGPEVFTFRSILVYILTQTKHRRPLLPIPTGLARLQATVAELLPGKPFTRDQLKMLGRDNVVAEGALGLPMLGITPTPIDLVVPTYLRRYRPGGGKREITPEELKTSASDVIS